MFTITTHLIVAISLIFCMIYCSVYGQIWYFEVKRSLRHAGVRMFVKEFAVLTLCVIGAVSLTCVLVSFLLEVM